MYRKGNQNGDDEGGAEEWGHNATVTGKYRNPKSEIRNFLYFVLRISDFSRGDV
jgi:hypothetical protein